MTDQSSHTALRTKVPGTASFSKFMNVLQVIADHPSSFNAAQLHKRVKLPRGTAHRIVAALMSEGLVAEDFRTGLLEVGPRLISLAARTWDRLDLRMIALEDIRMLRDTTGETVHLAVPSGREMVYVDKLESLNAVGMSSRIGARISLYATSVGKAYLAALNAKERNDLLTGMEFNALTRNTLVDRSSLEKDIEETKTRGYSIDREETELDIICYGCAIHAADGRPVGCLSITIPKYRLSDTVAQSCRESVVECARNISSRIATIRGREAF